MIPVEVLAVLMLVSFFVLLMAGVPVALTLATSGFVFGYLGFGALLFNLLPHRIFGVVTNSTLLAIPLFVFMGMMLERSRLAEDLMDVIGHVAGVAARRTGYRHHPGRRADGRDHGHRRRHRGHARPAHAAGHAAARLRQGAGVRNDLRVRHARPDHPAEPDPDPARRHHEPVGRNAVRGGDDPGLMLAGIYCVYILVLGVVRPDMVPAIPKEERALVSRKQLAGKVLRVVLPPVALVGAVLGSIIGGVAAPSEAASMGALGSIVITAVTGRLSWKVLRETAQATTKITAMMMFILICAQVFALAFRGLQGERLVQDFFELLPGGIWADIWFLMLIIFILGFFIEWIEISYIAVPLFLPVFMAANVDMVWLATLICVNLQTSFLTPPFGWALFFLRGVAPPEVKTSDIYRGIIPFVGLQLVALVLVFCFPGLATWLPRAIGW